MTLNGLILAGGFSTRMGMDKSKIDYHGLPQYQYLYELLRPQVDQVFISCRPEQQFEFDIPRIEDAFEDIGPLAGILSAFQTDPTSAWLMVACDMPFVNEEVIQTLISNRDSKKEATFFIDPETKFPEPMLTIFEPSIFPVLQQALQMNQLSLNKILQYCDGQEIVAVDSRVLRSVNTREEFRDVVSTALNDRDFAKDDM